jgi:periplasmic divalent cation tolerance protein
MNVSEECCVVYVTADNIDQARYLARSIVERRLAACANIIPVMESLYWWDGAVQSSQECVLILKTTRVLLETLIEAVKTMHTYQTPCIVALPIIGGNPDFIKWISDETNAER